MSPGFVDTMAKLDTYLASDEPLGPTPEILFQGRIADSLSRPRAITTRFAV